MTKTKKMNPEKARAYLADFNFRDLFVRQVGWEPFGVAGQKVPQTFPGEITLNFVPTAELSGAKIICCETPTENFPDAGLRKKAADRMAEIYGESLLFFTDSDKSRCIVLLRNQEGKKVFYRQHYFYRGQSGDAFLSKLAALFTSREELRKGEINISAVTEKIRNAFDNETVTKKFFSEYQNFYKEFTALITGIPDERDRQWYASVLLNRLMFIYFLQKKSFIDGGEINYLEKKLVQSLQEFGADKYYEIFLKELFFKGFALPENEREPETNRLLGKIVYLNGGLFLPHKTERKYPEIGVPDVAFENLFTLFKKYSWHLDDSVGGKDNEISPDVLGYIFEKYINQKAFGAYYTRPEITDYLCRQAVHKLVLSAVRSDCETVEELLENISAEDCFLLLNTTLPKLSLLDPACGSGAFLVAAMKVLHEIWMPLIEMIPKRFAEHVGLRKFLDTEVNTHPSPAYFVKKQIITANLYGADIMEEAAEIARLRLFLALVSAAKKVGDLEPLPNIDFNIMTGNSLIGNIRIDGGSFDKKLPQKPAGGKVLKSADLYDQTEVVQGNVFSAQRGKSYAQLIQEKEAAIRAYKASEYADREDLAALKVSIQGAQEEARPVLDQLLLDEFRHLKIGYKQAVWDEAKQKLGKPEKRALQLTDIQALKPFHWGYEFSEVFREKGGFDAVITNPPWDILKPNARDFFAQFSDKINRRKISAKEFKGLESELMQVPEVRKEWLDEQSSYGHQSDWYRSAPQFKNQISVVNGRKTGTDINLYKLFTEQCLNLLKPGGFCGIVIPSGIYTDLGAKQLRKMLFDQSEITGLFGFENSKLIFEGVHRSFKFVVLSFRNEGKTESFPAKFMRKEVEELQDFPATDSLFISRELIEKVSPDSFSVPEFKNAFDFRIAEKMSRFPLLGEELPSKWNIKLGREFDMNNDRRLFSTENEPGRLPLYEGKMVWQFETGYAEPRYYVNEIEGRKAVIGSRGTDEGQLLDYQCYRFGVRKITGGTNYRTLISSVIAPTFCSENFQVISRFTANGPLSGAVSNCEGVYLIGMWNSFAVDYCIRQSVSTNINFFYVYKLPVPRLQKGEAGFSEIAGRSAVLVCHNESGELLPAYAELWEEVQTEIGPLPHRPANRAQIRAELDAAVARLYGLNREELEYILGTFPLVEQAQKDLVLGEF